MFSIAILGIQRVPRARCAGKHQKDRKGKEDHSDQDPNAKGKKKVLCRDCHLERQRQEKKNRNGKRYPPVYRKCQENNQYMVWVFGFLWTKCQKNEVNKTKRNQNDDNRANRTRNAENWDEPACMWCKFIGIVPSRKRQERENEQTPAAILQRRASTKSKSLNRSKKREGETKQKPVLT